MTGMCICNQKIVYVMSYQAIAQRHHDCVNIAVCRRAATERASPHPGAHRHTASECYAEYERRMRN